MFWLFLFSCSIRGTNSSSSGHRRLLSDVRLSSKRSRGGAGLFKQGVLPSGFPHSVPPEYLDYQVANLIQDGCSYIRGVMSMGRVFEGLGVGLDGASGAAAAAVTIATRDGLSMVGSLAFSSYFKSFFTQNTKSWRLFADLLNNVALAVEIVAPAFPRYFVALLCLSALFRACVGVAAGSTGVVIANHWGEKSSNTAEVSAVNGNQHTLVSLSCLAVTFLINRATEVGVISINPRLLAGSFVALTLLHIAANVRAMRLLALRTLNVSRVKLLARSFIAGTYDDMTPASVARREPLLWLLLPNKLQAMFARIVYYAPLGELEEAGLLPGGALEAKLHQYRDKPYCSLAYKGRAWCGFTGTETALDRMKALLAAEIELRASVDNRAGEDTNVRVDELFPQFMAELRAKGWKTQEAQLLLPRGDVGYRQVSGVKEA